MSVYQHILCVTDFSASSDAALERAVVLARQNASALSLLHVIDYFPEDTPIDWVAPEDVDPASYIRERSDQTLAERKARYDIKDMHLITLFTEATASNTITQFAQDKHMDLIIIGPHVVADIESHLSSVVDGVVHAATTDVLVVR